MDLTQIGVVIAVLVGLTTLLLNIGKIFFVGW
jgi:hypothetical protein